MKEIQERLEARKGQDRGAWFISTTHEDAVIDETLDGLRGALASL